jgi:hypothetical protein
LPAQAAETISFGQQLSLHSKFNIERYLTENKEANISAPLIASLDLNEDGIVEFIVRDSGCTEGTGCPYLILAETDSGIIVLGEIEARKLALGKGYTNGVRDLMALKDPRNDFQYQRYVWEPMQSRYTMASGGS